MAEPAIVWKQNQPRRGRGAAGLKLLFDFFHNTPYYLIFSKQSKS